VAAAGNVYLPVILRTGVPAGGSSSAVKPAPSSLEGPWRVQVSRPGSPIRASRAYTNLPAFDTVAAGTGHINTWPDRDGKFRRLPMVMQLGDSLVPSLSLQAACDILAVDRNLIDVAFGKRIRLPGATMPDGTVKDIDIPVDGHGMAMVDLPGPWQSSFSVYPFSNIIKTLDDPELAASASAELYGGNIIVADLTTASSDYGPTSFDAVYPLAGLHAAMLDSIISDRFIRYPHPLALLAWSVLLALSALLAITSNRTALFILVPSCTWLAAVIVQFSLFSCLGILPTLAGQSLGLGLSMLAATGYRYLESERERVRFRSRMEQYFAPALISRIIRTPDRFMVAERKVITILFSDIAGFTTWCSSRGPDEIHLTLNRYFELMTEIVFQNEGTVDKFIGDGLMAFFGDPVSQPDHASRAVRTAIQMQQALRAIREGDAATADSMAMHIRIGINMGEAVVGDMGSRRIMAYTAIGSTVNLGSRLEGKAPVDGILVSEPVFRAVDGMFTMKNAGRTSVKGLPDEFDTWEVLVP